MTLCKKFKTHKLPLSPVFQGFAGVFFSLTVKDGIVILLPGKVHRFFIEFR